MADNQIHMPSGMGGITRYFDEYTSKIQIKPATVIILIAAVIVFEIVIRL